MRIKLILSKVFPSVLIFAKIVTNFLKSIYGPSGFVKDSFGFL